MVRDESLELADQTGVLAERELGLDASLERREPELLEPGDLTLRERFVLNIGEGWTAPERECLPKPLRRLGGQVTSERFAAGRQQVLELSSVSSSGARASA
jgi:hypothetical protein